MQVDIDRALSNLERMLNVTIVLHDRAGILQIEGLRIPSWHCYHRHLYCRTDRTRKTDYDKHCMAHCFRQVNERAARTRDPFVHTCWKGAQEVVVPLYIGPAHVATLFAGVFRAPELTASDPELAFQNYPGWRELPVLEDKRRNELIDLLWLVGGGLVQVWQTQSAQPSGRKGVVFNFLQLNAHRNPKLEELAQELTLSPSRTSHLIRELFGCGFQRLLTLVRLDRARMQLRQTNYTVERIALGLGFQSAGYLHRIFVREYGQTPGEFRKAGQPALRHNPAPAQTQHV